MKKALLTSVAVVALVGANAAYAGNITLTGHDNDFHWNFGGSPGNAGPAGVALQDEVDFVRNGSSLGLLTFDQGTELTTALASLFPGVTITNVSTIAGVGSVAFNPAAYSAMIVASETTCGGCDNSAAFIAAITARKTDIGTFLDAGGGILGLAGATDPAAYAYVPESATNPGGSPPSTGYFATALGISLDLPEVNGNTTHNFFSEPGSAGLSAAYGVTERNSFTTPNPAETVALATD